MAEKFSDIKVGMPTKIAYGFANMGGNMIFTAISSFVTIYYTDSMGIAAAVVGTMMLLTRFLDGISDVVMGAIIDKTHTKIGQALPWYIVSIIPLAISMVLVFSMPQHLSDGGKVLYMYITYIFAAVICYTMNALSSISMLSLMTGNEKERMGLNASSQIFGFITIITVNMITTNIVAKVGWHNMSIIFAVIGTIMLLITAFVCKEQKHKYVVEEEQQAAQATLKEGLPSLLKDKYFYIVLCLGIANYITIGTFNAGGVYYATYMLGNPGLFGIMTLAGMLPTILLSTLVPKIGSKFGMRRTLMAGYLLSAVGYLANEAVQPASSLMAMRLLVGGIPAVCGVIGIIVASFFDIEKKTAEIRKAAE